MDLGLRGNSLQSVLIENTVRMQFSDVYFVVIESPFRLDIHGDSFSLSPEEEPDAGLQPLRQLVGHTIEQATADAVGGLHVIFEGGARLTSSLTQPMKLGAFRPRTVRWSSAQREASWPFGSHSRTPTNPLRRRLTNSA